MTTVARKSYDIIIISGGHSDGSCSSPWRPF
jgi:hypothetical protein